MKENRPTPFLIDSESEIELEILSDSKDLSDPEQGPFLDKFTTLESFKAKTKSKLPKLAQRKGKPSGPKKQLSLDQVISNLQKKKILPRNSFERSGFEVDLERKNFLGLIQSHKWNKKKSILKNLNAKLFEAYKGERYCEECGTMFDLPSLKILK